MLAALAIVALAGGLFVRGKTASKHSRPNILLIVTEDHGPHLSCYGDTVIQTPHLDALAASGFLFQNAYVTESVCSPSRSSILTGLYPHQNGQLGLTTHGFHLVGDIKNIFSILKKGGYRTGLIGKLHVDPPDSFLVDYWPLKSPNYTKKALDRYARYAARFMTASDTPFFLMVNYPDTHWPFQDVVDGKPAHPVSPDQVVSFPYIDFDNPTIRQYTASLYNCMMRLDDCIGDLMDRLRSSGKRRNTLVICLSDHGDEMARGKFAIYEASTRVPFLVSWPGTIEGGRTCDALVSSIDIVPTILDVAGMPPLSGLSGKSLIPLLKNPHGNFREYLYTEKNCDQIGMYFPRRAVRDKRYKLIYSLLDGRKNEVALHYTADQNRPVAIAGSPTASELREAPDSVKEVYAEWIDPPKIQLYDLAADPLEFHNLSEDKRYLKIKNRLMGALFSWQRETNDPLRFPDKLERLTEENDTMKVSKQMVWHYPQYLYGQ